MQVAVMLELLLMRPIRRGNLVALRLGEHVVEVRSRTVIAIDGAEVKNDVDHDYPVPAESVRLLDFYVGDASRVRRPLFGTFDNAARVVQKRQCLGILAASAGSSCGVVSKRPRIRRSVAVSVLASPAGLIEDEQFSNVRRARVPSETKLALSEGCRGEAENAAR